MLRKFECWNCNKTFLSDDKDWVECPHCHSDNVDYRHFHITKILSKRTIKFVEYAICASLFAGIACFLINRINIKNGDNSPVDPPQPDYPIPPVQELCVCGCGCLESKCGCSNGDFDGEQCGCECGICTCAEHIDIPPKLGDIRPIFDKDSEKYSFEVVWQSAPKNSNVIYVLTELFSDDVVIQTSEDGRFTEIQPSKDKDAGYGYRLYVKDRTSSTEICESREIFGFIPQKKVDKISSEQLKEMILSGTDFTSGGDEHISPNMVVISPDDPYVQTLTQAQQAIRDGLYTSINVSNIEYDDMNKISKVTINFQ